jgi:hypothetical protein
MSHRMSHGKARSGFLECRYQRHEAHLERVAYVAASLAFSWLFVQGVGWDRETARLVAVVGQLEIVLLVAAVLVRQSFSPLQRAYTWVGSFMGIHWLLPVSARMRISGRGTPEHECVASCTRAKQQGCRSFFHCGPVRVRPFVVRSGVTIHRSVGRSTLEMAPFSAIVR